MKLGCTPTIWTREATRAAIDAKIDPVALLAGRGTDHYVRVRWAVWRALVRRGYSYSSIGKASGFDHTTIRNACINVDGPYSGCFRPKRVPVDRSDIACITDTAGINGCRPNEMVAA